MRRAGLRGARRGKAVRTTVPETKAACPLDRVNRQFRADRPNQLWVADFTYVSTWQGFVYVAFVIDVLARCIVGWRVSSSMATDFVLDALAETINGLFKAEVIHRRGPWKTREAVELAALEWVVVVQPPSSAGVHRLHPARPVRHAPSSRIMSWRNRHRKQRIRQE